MFVQTAFIGDAILMTAMVEAWRNSHPQAEIHVCVRSGNEALFAGHPEVHRVWIWDKNGGVLKRYGKLLRLAWRIRSLGLHAFFTPHRHASSAILARFSRATVRVGFSSNPLASWVFTHVAKHEMDSGIHEVERNHLLIAPWTSKVSSPKLYPKKEHRSRAESQLGAWGGQTILMAPSSQWATKQWPREHWLGLIKSVQTSLPDQQIALIGGPGDGVFLRDLAGEAGLTEDRVVTSWELLESAALVEGAKALVTNDSGPLHIASAMNTPTLAIFCSTVPHYGFGPLAAASKVIEVDSVLDCRPCGLHGHQRCPLGHFACGWNVDVSRVAQALQQLASVPENH